MKQRMQGVVVGVLTTALLLGAITVYASVTRTIEVTVGTVRTTIFGQEFVVRDDQGLIIEPFTYNGRPFLPAESILHAMGANAQWNSENYTFNFGIVGTDGAQTGLGAPFARTVPPYDVSRVAERDRADLHDVRVRDFVIMGGVTYEDVITYRISTGTLTWSIQHSLHNLNGQFSVLTGYIGRVDGWSQNNAWFTFIGDGRVIESFELRGTDLPRQITVDVSGVRNLKIQFYVARGIGWHQTMYAFAGTIR